MGIVYAAIGFAAVPGILVLFHWLSRTPGANEPGGRGMLSVADEAERWLRSQR